MADFNSLLNTAASYGETGGVSNRVKAAVETASQLKKDALRGTTPVVTNRLTGEQSQVNPSDIINAAVGGGSSYGEYTATGVERDLRDMNFDQLVQKYGDDAYKLSTAYGEAKQGNLVANEMANHKPVLEGVKDNLTDVAVGVGSIAKIGAMGLGLVSDRAGAASSTFLSDLDAYAASTQSQARQRTRAQSAVLNDLDTRDNKQKFEEDVKTDGAFLANLYREGRNALGAVSIDVANPEMLAAGLSQAGGSLLTAAPLAKGIAAVGSKIVPLATQRSIALSGAIDANMGTLSASRALASVGKNGAFPAAVGLLEGSGAYAEVVSTGMKLPFETLAKESDEYNALIAKGVSPEEARLQVVSAAAKTALAIQAPLAAATGLLVSKFESNLFKRVSLRQSGGNMGRETLEEGTQGLTGELSKNFGIRQNLNNEQDLFEGTGKATGTGALYGMGISGVVQAPTLAANVIAKGVKAGANALIARANKVNEANEAASPVSPTNLQTAGQAAAASVAGVTASVDAVVQDPASTLSDEDKINLTAKTAEITAAYGVNENEFDGGPPEILASVKGAKSVYEVIAGLAKVIDSTSEDNPAHVIASHLVYEKIKKIEDFLGKNQDFLNALPEGDPARNAIAEFQTFGANLMQSKVVVNSIAKITASLQNQQNTGKTVPITDKNATTPEAQQSANETATLAALAPDKVNPEAVRRVLFHASKGSINITPAQEAALQVASAVLKNTVPLPDDMTSLSGMDTVSMEAVNAEYTGTSTGSKGFSAVQHASRIANAVRLGNIEDAAEMMKSFAMFAEHSRNRSRALLVSMGKLDREKGTGPKVNFKQLVQGEWQDQMFNGFRTAGKGIEFAARVAKESEGIIGLHNDLAKLFPELNSKEIKKNAEDIFAGSYDAVFEKITQHAKGTYKVPARAASTSNTDSNTKNDTKAINASVVEGFLKRIKKAYIPEDMAFIEKEIKQANLSEGELATLKLAVEKQNRENEGTVPPTDTSTDDKTQTSQLSKKELAAEAREAKAELKENKKALREAKLRFSDLQKNINRIERAIRKLENNKGNSLWTALKHSLNPKSLNDLFGSDWKKKYTFLRMSPKMGKEDGLITVRIEAGSLDDWLPPNLRFGSISQNDDVSLINEKKPDLNQAMDYIASQVSDGNYLTFEVNQEIEQLGLILKNLDSVLSLEDISTLIAEAEQELANAKENVTRTTEAVNEGKRAREAAKSSTRKPTSRAAPVTPVQATEPAGVTPTPADTDADTTTAEGQAKKLDVVASGLGKGLLNVGFNFLVRGFKFAGETKTSKLLDSAESTATMFRDLSKEFVKGNSKATILLDAYSKSLNKLRSDIKPALAASLKAYLSKATKNGKINYDNILESDDKATNNQQNMMSGKLLNFTTPIYSNDGKQSTLVFDENYLNSAILATQQWLMETGDLLPSNDLEKRAASILGISESEVDYADIGIIINAITRTELVDSLASKLEKYWGIVPKRDQPAGFNVALSKAYASQIINALVKTGYFEESLINTTSVKSIRLYRIPEKTKTELKPLQADPSFIDKIVLVTPEETVYVGEGSVVPISQNILRNKSVETTGVQKIAQDNEQKTPHYVDTAMVNLYQAFGLDNLKLLFNIGWQGDPELQHREHKESTEGSSKGFTAAYEQIMNMVDRVSYAANGKNLDKIPIYYKYEFISTGRLNMMGLHNPQANKLMRHAILPTKATLDVTPGTRGHSNLMLGIGQQLGIKVHNQSRATTLAKVESLMVKGGAFYDVIQTLDAWLLNQNDADATLSNDVVKEMLEAFKKAKLEATPMALFALLEYTKFTKTTAKEKTEFTTNMYVEADGVSNGPIAALYMLSNSLGITPKWLENMRRGGLFFGSKIKNLNEYRSSDVIGSSIDLYKKTANVLSDIVGSLYAQPVVNSFSKHITILSDVFLEGMDVKDGKLVIERGLTKNPLTITVYGSSSYGIAGKLAKEILSAYYASISETAMVYSAAHAAGNKMTVDEAMAIVLFKDKTAVNKIIAVKQAITYLTENSLKYSMMNGYFKEDSMVTAIWTEGNLGNRVMTEEAKKAFMGNIDQLIAQPMAEAIEKEMNMGGALVGAELIKSTTQIKSIYLKYAYIKAYNAYFKENKGGLVRKKADGLSSVEMEGIAAELRKVFPLVSVGYQNFDIAGKEPFGEGENLIGEDLSGKKVSANNFGPSGSGSAGVPYLVIGLGDGQMMQIMAADPNGPQGTLKIFDGMHMKMSTLDEDSVQANKAVWQSWNTNPYTGLSESFGYFYENYLKDLKYSSLTSEMYVELRKVIWPGSDSPLSTDTFDSFTAGLIRQVKDLYNFNLTTQARQEVLSSYEATVDQMAAVGSSYVNPGKEGSSVVDENGNDKSDKILAAEMSEKIKARYAELVTQKPNPYTVRNVDQSNNSKTSSIKELLAVVGEFVNKGTGSSTDLAKTLKVIKESKILNNYSVEYVTFSELQVLAGLGKTSKTVNGMLDVDKRIIYLTTTNSEYALHEVIHAATIQIVAMHYAGTIADPVRTAEVAEAVSNLEKLMSKFVEKYAQNKDASVINLLAAISTSDKVANLNEFMAWTLTNQDLINKGKALTDPSFLDFIKQTIKNLINIIFGKDKTVNRVNAFDGVLFNSGVLIKASESNDIVTFKNNLHHSTGFGTDYRLSRVANSFEKQVVRFLKANINPLFANSTAPLTPDQTTVGGLYRRATGIAAQAVTRVSSQFAMSKQESTTLGAIVAALATGAAVDGNSMTKVQELYSHVLKNLSASDFLADPNSNDPNALFIAQGKYDIIAGNLKNQIDGTGKTSILPIFLGLSIVNEEFRNILSKIKLPEKDKNNWSSTDNALESVGNSLMDGLEDLLTNKSGKKANVQEAMNALLENIIAIEEDRKNAIERTSAKTGTYVDVVNDKIVDMVQRHIDKASKKLSNVRKNTNSKLLKNTAAIAELTLGIVSEKNSSILAEGVTTAMNVSGFSRTFADIVSDVIGRIDSNSTIYDMIKITRSAVSQNRQMYREKLPTIIAAQFNGNLSPKHWKAQFKGMGKTDLAALVGKFTVSQIVDLMENPSKVTNEIIRLEAELKLASPKDWAFTQFKSKQLAEWMNTGKVGVNLLRNAVAISQQPGTNKAKLPQPQSYVDAVDQLVSLYAFKTLAPDVKQDISFLVQTERAGIEFVLSYLSGQRKGDLEIINNNPMAIYNHYKGYIPSDPKEGISLIVAKDSEYASLMEKSYTRVGNYVGDPAGPKNESRGYYTSKVAARAMFSQGLIQNVHESAGGISTLTGFSNSLTAGVIVNRGQVAQIRANLAKGNGNVAKENLMPIFDSDGNLVAYERSVDPVQMEYLEGDTHIAKMIGVWRGRQVEEAQGQAVNKELVQRLFNKYNEEFASKPNEYVDAFSPKFLKTDPVIADAMKLMPIALRNEIKRVYGGNTFMVRADMLKDVAGYRAPSVGDAWTKNSRWSPRVLEGAKRIAISVFGNKAYEYFINSEKILKNFVSDAKVIIVVKSVIVPVGNLISNVLQLVARGVPITTIMREMPKKLNEINSYVKGRNERIDLEAKLRVAQGNNDIVNIRKLTTAMQVIDDAHKTLSIWSLIEAGEFSAIADAGIAREEIILSEGRLNDFMENMTARLPKGVRTLGKYALVTKDTALFQGLQKAMEYGDFLGKAVRYDDLRSRGKMNQVDALAGITEEFANYDVLPGRLREGLEDFGLLWFYSYKLRMIKTAASLLRKNPLHSLMSAILPIPADWGVGGPIQDNGISKVLEGNLGYSVGLGQGFGAIGLNPWVNLTN